jgi:hypothetical protein
MSKLKNKAKKSKLSESVQQKAGQTFSDVKPEERIVRQIKPKDYPRSYRLDAETMNALKDTLNRLNEISPKKISEARLIKALIALSREMNEDKLMKALKEVW